MKVINDLLNFNNMKIVQDNDYFNFSLDSVLLVNFIKILPTTKNIIDLGTGNAPIPLMLSTKCNNNVNLKGVELQKEIFDLALESLTINNMENRIQLLNINIKDVVKFFDTDTFDIVTCNPPYFKYDKNSLINSNHVKSIARHEIEINLDDIFLVSRKILKNKGSLYLVHRTDRFAEIICLLSKYNLQPKRVQFIYSKDDSNSNLVLIEAVKNGNVGFIVQKPIIVHDYNGNYKKEVLKMFGDDLDVSK